MVEIVQESLMERGDVRSRRQPQQVPSEGNKEKSENYDINLGNKGFFEKYLTKIEKTKFQEPTVCPSEFNLMMRNHKHQDRKSKAAEGGRRANCSAGLIRMAVFAVLMSLPSSYATSLTPTQQLLPPACLSWFNDRGNDCPDDDSSRADMTQVCCLGYAGTTGHCQMDEQNGVTYSIAACLSDHIVPPGKIGKLIVNETGYPVLDLHSDCGPGTYRSQSITSSSIRFQYCTEVKTRAKENEEVACYGGPSADDVFVCKKGYRSDCTQGHNDNDDSCFCAPYPCGEGLQPFRNFTGHCNDSSFRVEYTCTTPGKSTRSSMGTPVLTSTTSDPTSGNTTDSKDRVGIIIGVFGGIVVLVVIIFCLVRSYCKSKTGRSEYSKNMSDLGSSSEEGSVSLNMPPDGE